jgi:hypothetical protein
MVALFEFFCSYSQLTSYEDYFRLGVGARALELGTIERWRLFLQLLQTSFSRHLKEVARQILVLDHVYRVMTYSLYKLLKDKKLAYQ